LACRPGSKRVAEFGGPRIVPVVAESGVVASGGRGGGPLREPVVCRQSPGSHRRPDRRRPETTPDHVVGCPVLVAVGWPADTVRPVRWRRPGTGEGGATCDLGRGPPGGRAGRHALAG